jgi:hypothetical protein
MNGCLLQGAAADDEELYDHRYFYVDRFTGHYTCGLARDVMAKTLRSLGEDRFLNWNWISSFNDFKKNPSVLGFLVEQTCLSSIAQKGLHVNGLGFNNMPTKVFERSYPDYDLSLDLRLYIPFAYNFKAIDGLILSLDADQKIAKLVPIQVTISKNHSDSSGAFFTHWKDWTKGLEGYTIEATFLWITEDKRDIEEKREVLKKLRGSSKLVYPKHKECFVTVEDINRDIGTSLASARKKSGR